MQIKNADDAAALIQDGWTVASAGFLGVGHAEAVTEAIERRFLRTGFPRALTLLYSAGQGDRATRGASHFGHKGLVRRVIGGHWRSAPRLCRLAIDEEIEAFNLPQGVITQLYRAIAGGKPGVITRIGLHTFVDPRHGGARINARQGEDLVELVSLGGEEYLRYKPLPIDCALIRATTADLHGNLSTEHEPFHHELLAIAQAARNSGGIVIAQVKRTVRAHRDPRAVCVPGILVDHVVVVGEHPLHHAMTFASYFDPAFLGRHSRDGGQPWGSRRTAQPHTAQPHTAQPRTGEDRAARTQIRVAGASASSEAGGAAHRSARPSDPRLIVQRRALLELVRAAPRVVNLGVGMPAGVGALARAEGVAGFVLTVEAGPIGGTPADGLSFGAAEYPQAIVDQPAQFDFYDGGGLDMAFLGMAEVDAQGSVNVGVFGHGASRRIAGVGGFINITQSTRELVFMGTLTSGGLCLEIADGELHISREGRHRKFVDSLAQLSFNGPYAARRNTRVTYITERAVFRLAGGRLTLTELAPGVDAARDVLALCPAGVVVADSIATMDARIFRDGAMGLSAA